MNSPDNDLRQAVGALLVGKLAGTELDDSAAACLKDGYMGGITVFKENCASSVQLMGILAEIRSLCEMEPVLTVDQEGGPVQRLEDIATAFPSFRLLGELQDPQRVERILSFAARELFLLGFNVVLSPVLDVATNPLNPIIGTRAFAETAESVIANGTAALAAYLGNGVVPVGKHFPGHGDTAQDSHSRLAIVTGDKERLEAIELAPFRALLSRLPALLVAHVWVRALQPEPVPATLSAALVSGLLKRNMHFSGCVFTDDMLMKAITNEYGLEEACVQAVIAGCDQVLVCSHAQDVRSVHAAIVKAVEQGRLSEARLAEALQKRKRLLSLAGPQVQSKEKRLALLEELMPLHKNEVEKAYKDGFAKKGNCSLKDVTEWLVVAPQHPRYALDLCQALVKEGGQLNMQFTSWRYPLDLDEAGLGENQEELDQINKGNSDRGILYARNCKNIIFVSFRAQLYPAQIELAKRLAAGAERMILVAADNPVDSVLLDCLPDQLLTYDPSDLAIQCAAALLLAGN